MKVLGLVPARKGSKGVPGKNKALISGRPLIDYTIESALGSKAIDDIVISTDDDDIIKMYSANPNIQIIRRPAEFATDIAKSIDVIKHTLIFLKSQGKTYDCVCLLQPTSPSRSKDLINTCVQKYISANGSNTVITMVPVPHQYNPEWTFRLSMDGFVIPNNSDGILLRRQDLPEYYVRDGAVYVINARLILDEHTLYSKQLTFVKNDHYLNIDNTEDLKVAQKFLSNE